MSGRVAIILFNLGGPDGPEAVEPFLLNLFSDPAILSVPGFLRGRLARLIARKRAPIAREIYAKMGGGSPILPQTEAQARALEAVLAGAGEAGGSARVFTVMRYWHPRAADVAREVKAWGPERIVLLPLYPQFSTTTTGSSLAEWAEAAAAAGLDQPTHTICCYPREAGFLAAHARAIEARLAEVPAGETIRILFSAHGLPERVIKRGDPYQWQVERTVEALVDHLNPRLGEGLYDWRICYQSRVGPLKWIGPSTEDEIRAGAAAGRALVVVPIAFVSEHSETLVELDDEYRHLAEAAGARTYLRVPALGVSEAFIGGLGALVADALARPPGIGPHGGRRICNGDRAGCPCASQPLAAE
ncbi:MAG: ferrochelatase [Alphaproteobacteria bacterium]|nr:ferrochelatase [Alphaproteobacteria bacterium]